MPRLRDFAMVTFVSKLDRDGCDPFYLSDEIERSLTLDSTRSQPIAGGDPIVGASSLHSRLASP